METYKEQIIQLLKEKGDYNYGLLGWVADQYTVGELMQNQEIYNAVTNCFGDMFVDELIDNTLDDPDCDYRDEILSLIPG
jgi:hypothetical protein